MTQNRLTERKFSNDHSYQRHRKSVSSGSLSIEELSEDEVGYDGDIEVIRPDQYEEPESEPGESEAEPIVYHAYNNWQNKLSERMQALDCNSDTNDSQDQLDRPPSRKRSSRQLGLDTNPERPVTSSPAGLEIIELENEADTSPLRKRIKRRIRRTKTNEKSVNQAFANRNDIGAGDRSKEKLTSSACSGSSRAGEKRPDVAMAGDEMEVD
jgi:hypothetical protein